MFNKRIPLYKTDSTGDLQLQSGYIFVLRKYPFTSNTIVGEEASDAPGHYDCEDIAENVLYQRWTGTTLGNLTRDLTFSAIEGTPISSIDSSLILDPVGEDDGVVPMVLNDALVFSTADEILGHATISIGGDANLHLMGVFTQKNTISSGKLRITPVKMSICDLYDIDNSTKESTGRYKCQFVTFDTVELNSYAITHVQRTSETQITIKVAGTNAAHGIIAGTYIKMVGLLGSDIVSLPGGADFMRVISVSGTNECLMAWDTDSGTISVVDFQTLDAGTGYTGLKSFKQGYHTSNKAFRWVNEPHKIVSSAMTELGWFYASNLFSSDFDYGSGILYFESRNTSWVLTDDIMQVGRTFDYRILTQI